MAHKLTAITGMFGYQAHTQPSSSSRFFELSTRADLHVRPGVCQRKADLESGLSAYETNSLPGESIRRPEKTRYLEIANPTPFFVLVED